MRTLEGISGKKGASSQKGSFLREFRGNLSQNNRGKPRHTIEQHTYQRDSNSYNAATEQSNNVARINKTKVWVTQKKKKRKREARAPLDHRSLSDGDSGIDVCLTDKLSEGQRNRASNLTLTSRVKGPGGALLPCSPRRVMERKKIVCWARKRLFRNEKRSLP